MNRASLRRLLASEEVSDEAYGLHPDPPQDETYRLEPAPNGWVVYYSERGLCTGEQLFETEDEACKVLAELLLRDPTTRAGV